jgi:hypothetical protein
MLVRPMPPKSTPTRIRLRPQDPFDLIRLLARSQSDPRKALAELVQNSLDAGARRIDIRWFNEKAKRALRIWDDGEGIFPALERREALERIARTIGHSHKRALSPAERREQMVLGKYGIGLIGFWSVGHEMEIKSRVGGGETWSLKLVEDDPRGEVQRTRTRRTDEELTYTEISIRGVHPPAARQVRPPRLQAFLASELRGQLLERGAAVRIHDHVARGRATKEFLVQAQPYLGTPLPGFDTLPVEGFEDARVELYLVSQDEDRTGRVALACGGTTVLDDLSWIEGPELPRAPWSSGRLEGVVDFPELEVAPGSRRGFAPNAASEAFIAALARLERDLAIELARDEERRAEERQRNLAREIRKAFLPIAARLPEYDLFEVRAGPRPDAPSTNGADEGAQLGEVQAVAEPSPEPESDLDLPEPGEEQLFPPGPLAAVRILPANLRLPPLAQRTLRARALDADGRPAAGPVQFEWHLLGPGAILPDADRCRYLAPPDEARATLLATARHGPLSATAQADVQTLPALAGREKVSGIPEPHPIHAPGEPWRSRVRGDRWEFNTGHRDYLEAAGSPSRRLRYMVHLFAKEIVLRNFGGDEAVLERMVQVLTHIGAGAPG